MVHRSIRCLLLGYHSIYYPKSNKEFGSYNVQPRNKCESGIYEQSIVSLLRKATIIIKSSYHLPTKLVRFTLIKSRRISG